MLVKTHKMRGVGNEVRGRLKVLISLSFIAESQSICLKLNMDLFIPLQSVSTLLVFLSPFSLRSFSSPCFLSYFPFCSWFTVNWWILHLYQVTRYCPALLLWLIPLPLFRKKSSYGGFCWWIQTHHCGEETLFFFSFTMSHLWAHFLFSFFLGPFSKGWIFCGL